MARKDALLRLHERLIAKREALREKLAEDLGYSTPPDAGLDAGEAANRGEQTELSTQLAALESRELRQIERAIHMIRDGRYGICEHCERPIPIARLQALPFTIYCVECQQEQDNLRRNGGDFEADWETAIEYEGRSLDRDVSLSDLDVDF